MFRDRPTSSRQRNRLAIFMYHGIVESPLRVSDWCFIDATSFERQIQYLGENFAILPLKVALAKLRNGGLEKPTAVITFDDGFQNNYQVAYEILRSERIPATIFPVTGLIDTNETLWYCRLNEAFSKTSVKSLSWFDLCLDLSDGSSRAQACARVQERLKLLPHSLLELELQNIVGELCGANAVVSSSPDLPLLAEEPAKSAPETMIPFRMLTRREIAEMAQSGLIDFGAHTQSHEILNLLSPRQQREEIEHSVADIQELTGLECRFFAYPNGGSKDYNAETIAILKQAGIEAALTAVSGNNDVATPSFELRRHGIGANLNWKKFKSLVNRILVEKSP